MPVFSDFAISVQSTRETVSNTVSQLEKRGLLKRVEGGLQVVARIGWKSWFIEAARDPRRPDHPHQASRARFAGLPAGGRPV